MTSEPKWTKGPWSVRVFEPSSVGMNGHEAVQSLAHAVVIGDSEYTVAHTRQKVADIAWVPIPYNECGETGLVRSKTIKKYNLDRTPHPDAVLIAAVPEMAEALEALLNCPDIADSDYKDEETHAAERKARAALAKARGSGERGVVSMAHHSTAPETPERGSPSDLVRRLRGEYRIPIKDGLGPAGGDEPNNPHEFVRHYPTSPIKKEAADCIEALENALQQALREGAVYVLSGETKEMMRRALAMTRSRPKEGKGE